MSAIGGSFRPTAAIFRSDSRLRATPAFSRRRVVHEQVVQSRLERRLDVGQRREFAEQRCVTGEQLIHFSAGPVSAVLQIQIKYFRKL